MKNRRVAEGMIIGLRLATLAGGEKDDHVKKQTVASYIERSSQQGLCGNPNIEIEPRVKG